MPSNVQLNSGTGGAIAATKQVTHDGDTAQVQMVGLFGITGSEDAYTATLVDADANGLRVSIGAAVPGTGATNLGKAEDAAAADGDVGVAVLTQRQDTPIGSTSADGDYQFLKTDSVGRLHVNGSGVTQPVSGTVTANLAAGTNNIGDVDVLSLPALPAGTNNIGDVDVLTLPALPAGTNNIGDVDVASLPATSLANGNLVQVDYDSGAGTQNMPMVGMALPASGGAVAGGTSTNPLRTDPTGTTTQPVSGTVTANLAAGTNNIGDVDVLSLPTLPAGTNNIGDVDIASFAAGAITEVQGDVAHDAAVGGNPVLIGAEARTTNPTAVANGDAVRVMADDRGSLVVTNEAPRDLVTGNTRLALTSTTETTLVAAVASQFNDLSMLILSNESATEVRADIRDATAGTVRISVDLAADGGGAVLPFPVPYPQTTANNNWTVQLSAAVSTVYVTAVTVARN